MKVVVKDKGSVAIPFPKLMLSINGSVVYMAEAGRGVILLRGKSSLLSDGCMSDNFTMDNFTDFVGTVELSNE